MWLLVTQRSSCWKQGLAWDTPLAQGCQADAKLTHPPTRPADICSGPGRTGLG